MSSSKTSTAASRPSGGADLLRMRRAPTHPGEVFEEEWRKPSALSQAEAARRMGMSANRLNEIVAGKRAVTAETAVLFAALTGTSPQVWLHLQTDYDLWHALRDTDTSTIAPLTTKTRTS
jgi:addiction module HigA family antidote